MSKNSRYRTRSKSRVKAKPDVEPTDINQSLEDSNDSIPFQRLDSPRPPSPSPANFISSNAVNTTKNTKTPDCDRNDDVGSIDNDEPEPFASLGDSYFEPDLEGDGEGLRPPSQNSIASVIKHSSSVLKNSFQEAKHMIHLCGVGVGANNPNEFADGEIPDIYKNELPKFYSTGSMSAYQDSIPSRTNTTSSSSLSTHFDKHGSKCVDDRKALNHPQSNMKTIPFPQSIYSSTNDVASNNDETQIPILTNKKSIPLRHSQSVPFKTEPVEHLFMRRSASTPAAFKIGRGRSAFGKVDSNNIRNRVSTHPTPNDKGTVTMQAKHMSDSKCQPRSNSMRDLHSAQDAAFNSINLSTPAKRWVSSQETTKKVEKKKPNSSTETLKDVEASQVSTDDTVSVASRYSKSNIMNSKTQRKIKERRKERRKLQKENNDLKQDGQTVKSSNDSSSYHNVDCTKEREDYPSHQKIDTVDEKGNVSYLSLEAGMEQIAIGQDVERIDDSSPIRFSQKIVSGSKSRNIESPPIPPTLYHKIVDEDHLSPNTNPPIPLPHNRRSSRTSFSQIDRVGTPQSHLVSPQRIRGSFSPGSLDSASLSRNSRSGQSVNTSSQTISTFISCNASCNRSVTSSVAEADREVRDTNRRELKRREGADLDGSMSIQSSDTISTNAFLALTSSPAQLRDGANIHHDRFFGCNSSVGAMNSQSSNASSMGLSYNQNYSNYSPGMNGRNLNTMNVRSPITVSSNSVANNTNSSTSTGEDPPRFVSCSSKVVPINTNRGVMPPRSDQHDSSTGYTKLGTSDGRYKSGSSSRSSSSKSTKSKSSRSKSSGKKKKDKPWGLYHKIGSAKVADHNGRASTPSPCNSYQTSPVKTPITPPNQFDYPSELVDVPKPRVRRHFPIGNVIPGSKMVLVSPVENDRRKEPLPRPMASFWPPNGRDHRAFQPTVTTESVVTPEKTAEESLM